MENTIGLEAEYFLRDRDGKLLIPFEHNFSFDEYILLGEFRAEKGNTRAKCLANFLESFYETKYEIEDRNMVMDFADGWTTLTPEFYAELLRKMGNKEISRSENINDIDLLKLTDAIVKNGEIKEIKASVGLHIHFGSADIVERSQKQESFQKVNLPIGTNSDSMFHFQFYEKVGEETHTIKATANRITKPVVNYIVREFDEKILPSYVEDLPKLKYRNPGFYEIKPWGFEYRSLPFNKLVLDNIAEIVDFAFQKLEEL